MPLYAIRRDVGAISQEDMDAAAFRAIVCAPQFPGLQWIRSFWDREAGHLDCIYEADEPSQIEEHAKTARIPCDEIRVVEQVMPEAYIHG